MSTSSSAAPDHPSRGEPASTLVVSDFVDLYLTKDWESTAKGAPKKRRTLLRDHGHETFGRRSLKRMIDDTSSATTGYKKFVTPTSIFAKAQSYKYTFEQGSVRTVTESLSQAQLAQDKQTVLLNYILQSLDGQAVSAIVSNVKDSLVKGCQSAASRYGAMATNYARAQSCIDTAYQQQEGTTGSESSFMLSLSDAPGLRQVPLPRDPQVLASLEQLFKQRGTLTENGPITDSLTFASSNQLFESPEVMDRQLHRMQRSLPLIQASGGDGDESDLFAEMADEASARHFKSTQAVNSAYYAWCTDKSLFRGAKGKNPTRRQAADLMSPSLLEELNSHLPQGHSRWKGESKDSVPRPTEYLSSGDERVRTYLQQLSKHKSDKLSAAAVLMPDDLRNDVLAILDGYGEEVLARGDGNTTIASTLGQDRAFDFALDNTRDREDFDPDIKEWMRDHLPSNVWPEWQSRLDQLERRERDM